VALAEVADYFGKSEDQLRKLLASMTDEQKAKLLKDAAAIIDSGDVSRVGNLSLLRSQELASKVKKIAAEALEKGKSAASKEVGIVAPATKAITKQVVNQKLDLAIDERNAKIETAAKARLINAVNNGVGKSAALFDLENLINDQSTKANDRLSANVVIDSFNEGRYLAFDDPEAQAKLHGLQRSEILDDKTCPVCMSVDGKVLSPTDPFTFVNELHDNCRGMWVGVLKTDAELPSVKQLPKSITSRFNIVDGTPIQNDFKQLPKPIVTKGSRLERKIADGDIEV
jgi:hypothetical protein